MGRLLSSSSFEAELHEGSSPSRRQRALRRPIIKVLLALLSTLLLPALGCASRPYRPPPAEPLLTLPAGSARATGSLEGGTEGLIAPSRRSRVALMRWEIVSVATDMIGATAPSANGRRFRADCSGFVQAVYASAGIDLLADAPTGLNGVAIIHRHVTEQGRLHARRPLPGDLVFFDSTHGPLGSRLTHVGIVERVDPDATVVFVHMIQGRIVRGRLNRDAPGKHRDPENGRVLNDYLRRGSGGPRLAGELFAAYGTLMR